MATRKAPTAAKKAAAKTAKPARKTAAAQRSDKAMAGAVRDSAQQIWLAGMGAFAKAQEEGGRVFEALVKEGVHLQRKTQAVAEEKLGEVTDRMTAMAGSVTARAGQNWDKLEAIFEQRTAKALSRLGVPTAKDVQALVDRVDALAAAVERLNAAPAKAAAPRKTARKAAAKPAPVAEAPAAAAPEAPTEAPAPAKKRVRRTKTA
ncbi:phasin family protein [Rubrivivax benzoatilyticus]|uniref:Phasin family protein n=1 Tax=Rubrivivax benzoatilyticus TaxID=316997 RepID=A0ABX0HQ35_9BURK|nr:phasin family protein [Rubrivivax benzoatilyticus]EGJ10030.1 polygranule-associated protein [Rubrivivax benzoatilyticus JA2 = ATCC BAA-35]NHK97190.1 phasin family protein [Rubrivivax benzoatilyticus]NHL23115.1 phasin family protein [Rubrivivax benzoatilyticus]